jgi:hypothetical protein
MATYTGAAFSNDQYAQAMFMAHSSAAGSTGVCVRMNVAGSGVCYLADWGLIYSLANGAGTYVITSGCPIPASGDTIQLLVVATTYTCTDVTTGSSRSATDSTYPTGNPGILADQRNSTVYALSQFQADCSPSCGGISDAAISVSLTPASVTLTTSQSQAFTATVANTSNTAVTWSLSPAVGSISTAGLYTAPASITTAQTVTVTVISVANPVVSASATVSLIPAVSSAAVYPVSDTFTGSGALSANWTNTSSTGQGYVPLERSSETVVPSVSGLQGMATYTGASFSNDQYAQAIFVAHSWAAGSTGVCVRMNVAGSGVCYLADWGLIYSLANGAGTYVIASGCPIPANGDTIRLLVVGTIYTCTDVTTGSSRFATDSTYPTGNPGILVDQRNSTVYALAQFQADCSPSCGGISDAAISVTLTPASVTLTQSQTQAFTATVANTSNSAVTWSLSPAVGSISAAGLYTAPASITAGQTVTVKVTSVANPVVSASAIVSLVPTLSSAAVYPVSDTFSGSGALSANWTNTSSAGQGYVPLERSSGTVVPSVSGLQGMATYTGASFSNDQYAQAIFVAHSWAAGSTGVCVRMNVAGSGVCYLADWGLIYSLANGAGTYVIASGCPIPANGDTIRLLVVGTIYTCTDVTTGSSRFATDSTYPTGNPGILVDQRNSTVYALAQFQADCSPSCGGISDAAISVTLTPASVTLTQSQTQAFTATVANTSNSAVTWSLSPAVGSISTAGLYTAPASITAGQTVTVKVTSVPNPAISASATVSLATSTPTLNINATSIPFGAVVVNTIATQLVTLTSTGTAPVTISSATLAGTGYTMSGVTFPVTLNPTQAVTLNVLFDPTVTGLASGQLTITSNSSTNSTEVISLSGTGVAASYEVNLSWDAPSSSADPVAGYNIYRSPSGSSTYQLLNATEDTATTYLDGTAQSGLTYDYIVESVDASGVESSPSNMFVITIP